MKRVFHGNRSRGRRSHGILTAAFLGGLVVTHAQEQGGKAGTVSAPLSSSNQLIQEGSEIVPGKDGRPLTLLGEALASSLRKALATESPQDEEEHTAPPNVLMICIDDLNDWTGFLGGHPEVLTPHMDALAKRGRNFANAHCAVPVCSCSRISVMSGVAATRHGSYEIGPSYQQLPALKEIPTIQQYFKDHGYLTLAG